MTDGHIFLSYRSIEADFALKLAADLKNVGMNLWMDRLDVGIHVGDDWVQSLQDAIDNCTAVIAVLSPDYVESKYCRRELKRADTLTRPIFPVLLRKLETTQWPFEIQEKQYIDFRNWRDENAYRQQFADLFQVLQGRFPTQFGSVPDAETRYLISLIAELESRKGVLEYVELSAQAVAPEDAPVRPDPYVFDEWAAGFSMLMEKPHDPLPPTSSLSSGEGEQKQKISLKSIAEAVEKYPRFILIGEPGAGKTTTIRKLARDAARVRLENPHTSPLPLFLYLPEWGEEPMPMAFIRSHWPFDTDPSGLLKQGDVLLYLDGLNEMGSNGAEKAAVLRQWFAGTEAPARAVVTCRAGDYANELKLGDLPTVLAEELSEPQIRQFATNYLKEKVDTFLGRILPDDKRQREDARSLSRLARNSYLLAALIFVYDNAPDGDLPRNNGSLMRVLAQTLWERENQKRTSGWMPFEAIEKRFAKLALAMIEQDRPIDVPMEWALSQLTRQWLDFGKEKTQLLLQLGRSANLLEVRGDEVRFYHQLMQEYFAAIEWSNAGLKSSRPRFNRDGRISQKWDEVINAWYGISHSETTLNEVIQVDPWLAADCLESEVDISEMSIGKTISNLLKFLDDTDSGIRYATAKALLKVGWLPLDSKSKINYVIAIRNWTLCARLGTSVVQRLLEVSLDQDEATKLGAIDALRSMNDSDLILGIGYAISKKNQRALIAIKTNLADRLVPILLEVFVTDKGNVGEAAGQIIDFLGESGVPMLLEALRDKSSPIKRDMAAMFLGYIGDKSAIPSLIEALSDEYWVNAEFALKRIGTPEALEAVERWRRERGGE